MANPPSPRPPKAHSDGGGAPLSLFLDTDLGTHLAMLVAPHTTIRRLKLQVAGEHADAFPDLGPVAVKSFQVLRKGVLYHLSDSMTVTSAFTRIKGGCFLHAKMAEAAAVTHCCQDAPAVDGRRLSEGSVGIHVEKRARELPATISNIASDVLPQGLEGGDTAVLIDVHASLGGDAQAGSDPVINKAKSYSRQIKYANQTEGAFISSTTMANVDQSSNQSNMSHVVEEVHGKEDILHVEENHDVGGGVSGKKQVRMEEIHPMDDLPQQKECKKAKRAGSFDTSAADPIGITSEYTGDMTKSSSAPQETNTTCQQEVHGNVLEGSIQKENPSTVGKKKKKRRQLAHPKAVSAQETTEPSSGAVGLPKSTGDEAYNVEWTGRDEAKVRESDLPLSSSEPYDEIQGAKHVQFMSDAQTSTDLISQQGNFDHVHKDYRNPSIEDVIDSTAEVLATEGKSTKGSYSPWDGGEKHEEIEQRIHNERSHDEGVTETNNVEKDDKSTYALEKRHSNDNISREKKRKKEKKVRSAEMASMDTADEKEMHGDRENAVKSDTVSTEREIVHDPSMRQISNNVLQGDSNITENPSGDGKRKKKRRRQSESLKGVDSSQDLTKSSGFITNESSIQHTNSAHLDAKQTAQGSIEGAAVSDHKKLGESLDTAAANVIDEVLADLRSKDSLSKDLDGDILTEQTHLGSNQKAPDLPESTEDKVGFSAALPPKYPAAIHSDAPASSPRHKKSKRKQVKALSTMIDSSHYSSVVPDEDANTELNDSDSLRFSDKTSDHKDSLTGDVVAQADDKTKATRRQRKKVSLRQVPTDNVKATQSLDKQANQIAKDELKGTNATQADLVQGGSVIDTPSSTVGEVQKKGKKSSKTQTPKLQETIHSTYEQDSHLAKDNQDENVIGIWGTHGNENAPGAPTELHVVQEDATTLKSASPNARKERKKSSKTELQGQDSALGHDCSADLMNLRAEKCMISPKYSADAVEPNYHMMVHPASDEINFLDHFSSSKMNDPSVSVENKQNNEDETTRELKNKKKNKRKEDTGSVGLNDLPESLPTDKIGLNDHFNASEVVVPVVAAENMIREDENVKNGKEKKKRKRKPNLEGPAAEKDNTNCDNQGTDIGTQDSNISVVQKGNMAQNNGKESNNKVTHSDGMMQHEPGDTSCVRTLEKKLHQSDDGQNSLSIDMDQAHISKEGRKSTSQTKPDAKSRNHDESIKVRMGPKAVSSIVKSFSMSPPASSDSTEGTPQNANRYRVAVRKVTRKKYEQTSEKSKKESRKVGSGAIFDDAISEGSDDAMDTKSKKAAMEASSDNSSTSADSGISSAAYEESEVPGDDDTVSLSQSLKAGLHIGSILRGSSSYKKARQKQTELLDDITEVPDSQPADGLWDRT